MSLKKKTGKIDTSEFVSAADSATDINNKELRFQTFIHDQPLPYDTNLTQIPESFPAVAITDAIQIASSSESQYINFQDDQLLHSAIENNSAGKFFIYKKI